MYYDVFSSNTLQDKIKFGVLLFILYIMLQVSKVKGTIIIRRSISLFLKSSVHACMQGREITH